MREAQDSGEQDPQAEPVSLAGQVALVGGTSFLVLALFGIGLIMPGLKAAFAGSPQAVLVPWIATLVGPSFVITLPLAGYFTERFGYRRLYLLSIPLFAIAGTAPLFLNSLWVILPFRVLLGIATAAALTASLDGIGRLPQAQRARLLGLQNFGSSLVAIITYPVIGYLAKSSWHLPFATYLLPLVLLPLASSLPRGRAGSAAAAQAEISASGPFAGLSWILVFLGGTIGLIMFTGSVFPPICLASIGVADPSRASFIITASVITSMISAFSFSAIHRRCGTNMTFVISLLLLTAGFLICGTAPSPFTFTAGLLAYGAGIGLAAPNSITWALENSDASPGRTASFINMAFFLTPVAFPFIAGLIGGHRDPQRMFLLFGAAAAFWFVWFAIKAGRGVLARPRQVASPLA